PQRRVRALAADDLASPQGAPRRGARRVEPARDLGVLPACARRGERAAAYARRMKVLFVCVENAGRSQIAQALYERRGGEARCPARLCLEAVRERRSVIDAKVASLPI